MHAAQGVYRWEKTTCMAASWSKRARVWQHLVVCISILIADSERIVAHWQAPHRRPGTLRLCQPARSAFAEG